MKTLKRTLALVLVLALSVSVFAVAASAASYDDYTDAAAAKASKHAEAIDVVIGLGIIEGVSTTQIGVDGLLKREQAAKIYAYIALGEKAAEGLSKGATEFTDVKASDWASKYIAYAADQEILDGFGDGTYGPAKTLTGYQFGKILLNALGYGIRMVDRVTDEGKHVSVTVNDYTGTYWANRVSADGNRIGLFNGLEYVEDLNDPITRAQAMQMTFNALKIDVDGDIPVPSALGGSGDYIDETLAYAIEKYTTGVTDVCGRAGYKWITDDSDPAGTTVSGVYYEAPDYSFTAAKAEAKVGGAWSATSFVAAINDALGFKTTATKLVAKDGFAVADVLRNAAAVADLTSGTINKGDAVEVYLDDDGKIDKVIIIRYDLAKISDIDTNVTDADDKAAGVTSYIDTTEVVKTNIKNTEFVGFNYAKNDYVLIAVSRATGKENTVIASKAATIVSGKVNAIKGITYEINGTYYSTTDAVLDIGSEYTYAMNEAGVLEIAIQAPAAKSTNVAYIYAINQDVTDGGISADGVETGGSVTYTAYAVLSDGSKTSFTLATESKNFATNDDGDPNSTSDDKLSTIVKGSGTTAANSIVLTSAETSVDTDLFVDASQDELKSDLEIVKAYSINSKGAFEVADSDLVISNVLSAQSIDKDSALVDTDKYLTNDTLFIYALVNAGKGTMNVSTVTGYKNVNIDTEKIVVVSSKKAATVVYVLAEEAAATISGTLAVVLDATPVETKVGDTSYFTYSVSIDGKTTEIKSKGKIVDVDDTNSELTIAAGDVISYETTGEVIAAKVQTIFAGIDTAVTVVASDYIYAGSKIDTAGVPVLTITKGTDGKFTVANGGTFNVEDSANGVAASKIKAINYVGDTKIDVIIIAIDKSV